MRERRDDCDLNNLYLIKLVQVIKRYLSYESVQENNKFLCFWEEED